MAARRATSRRRTAKTKAKRAAGRPAKKKVSPVPPKYGSATPYLVVSPCEEALAFYQRVFGAKVLSKMPGPAGTVMHAELRIGDTVVMAFDEQPPMGGRPAVRKAPRSLGATSGGVVLYVRDIDAVYARAVEAGATGLMPPADMFWGDRFAQLVDPFGHVWDLGTHLRDVPARELQAALASLAPPPVPPA
jgi:PhnB protein